MIRKVYILVLMFIAAAGCNSGSSNTANTTNNNGPTPVPSPEKIGGPQSVTINSPDGVKLVGSLYEAGKPMSPALLLLHQWQSDRHPYDDFAKKMQTAGFNVLAIDGRGFGESTKKADGTVVVAGRTDADVKAMLGDVGAAFDFLTKNKNVDPKRIGIVGASYGSSLALIFAANNPNVAAVALLSPGLNYFGSMQTAPAMKKYGKRPVYMTAAEDDKDSADAVKALGAGATDADHIKKMYNAGAGHGTALFTSQPGLADELLEFFRGQLMRQANS
jgi:dienelactone hydrolase